MKSKIQNIIPYYSKFENVLPDEFIRSEITEELKRAKNELNKIIDEDLSNIKNLAHSQNKQIPFKELSKPSSIIRMAFYIEDDDPQEDDVLSSYAHWIMSLSTLQLLTQNVIQMSVEQKANYLGYINASTQEKGVPFNKLARAYQDFYGYLINIRNTITQYYDLFIQTCNEIDPDNKEEPIIAYKSDLGHSEILAATKELLLRGNMGRLAGFSLLRSAIEIFVTRELFDPKKSQKYASYQIIFPAQDIPSLKAIWKRIEKLHLEQYFKTDSLKRLYAWQSIVAHRGYLSEEYLIWFVYYHTAIEIIGAFKTNLKHYRDKILEELQKDGIIQIK